ncbi:MAG: glycerol-3-phosphate acyltransferase, partial [Nitrospirota bacterium]|nr:glycerol-3-phosphate acyltransferase [Nitrospirota bacterium]
MTCPLSAFNLFLFLLLPAAFVSGSIPFGVLFTRGKGIDLRNTGSKNIGATNVLRSAGKIPAVLTLICDMLKGAMPLVICRLVIANMHGAPHAGAPAAAMEDLWLGATGLAAVLGHMFPVFLSFRGGKGVATGFGVLLVYSPAVAGIMLLV